MAPARYDHDKLRTRREALGLTTREFSKRANIPYLLVTKYESGDIQRVREESIIRIQQALNDLEMNGTSRIPETEKVDPAQVPIDVPAKAKVPRSVSPKQKPKTDSIENELSAIRSCSTALDPLDSNAQTRVLTWLLSRFEDGDN